MPFTIKQEKEHDRVITMGQAAKVEPPVETSKPRRTRKMADEKEDMNSKSGVEVTREDDPGQQGPIGGHGQEAPAQDKNSESEGGKEE